MDNPLLMPDVICYNAAISSCAKGKQWEDALGLLQGMSCQSLTLDVVSYHAALDDGTHSLVRIANLLSRKQVWDDTVDYDIRWVVYHSLLRLIWLLLSEGRNQHLQHKVHLHPSQ